MKRTRSGRTKVAQSIGGVLSLAMLFSASVAGATDISINGVTGQQLLSDGDTLTVVTGGVVNATAADTSITAVQSEAPTGISNDNGSDTYGITNGTVTVEFGGSILATVAGTSAAVYDDILGYWVYAYAKGIEAEDGVTITNAGNVVSTIVWDNPDNTAHAMGIQVHNGNEEINGPVVIDNLATGTIAASASNTGEATARAIQVGGSMTDVNITNAGTLDAQATSTNLGDYEQTSAQGIMTGGYIDGLAIENSGQMNVSATAYADNELVYNASASAQGIKTGGYLTDVSITNSGDMTVTADAFGYDAEASVQAIHVGDEISALEGDLTALDITNDGTITATATASGDDSNANVHAIHVGQYVDGLAITNGVEGEITATASADYGASAQAIHTGSYITGLAVDNAGLLSATATAGVDTASAVGIKAENGINSIVDEVEVNGSINNSGYIYATATNTDATVSFGTGEQSESAAEAKGIMVGAEYDSGGHIDVINSGVIFATATAESGADAVAQGVQIGSDAADYIANTGSITAIASGGEDTDAFGVHVGGDIDGLVITNSADGEIVASVTAEYNGGARAIQTGSYITGLSIDNAGFLSASAETNLSDASAIGIKAENGYNSIVDEEEVNGSITNSGIIEATATNYESTSSTVAEAKGIMVGAEYDTGGHIDVINSGDIYATATAEMGGAVAKGVHIGSDASDYVANTGLIYAMASGTTGVDAFGIHVGEDIDSLLITNSVEGQIVAVVDAEGGGARAIQTGSYITGLAIENAGLLSASATATTDTASAVGVKAENGYNSIVDEVEVNGYIYNEGNIEATATNTEADTSFGSGEQSESAAEAKGIMVGAEFDTGGHIDIYNDGNIFASATAEMGADAFAKGIQGGFDAVGVIVNNGSVVAMADGGADTNAFGVQTGNGMELLNNGLITADITVLDDVILDDSRAVGIFASDIDGVEGDVDIYNAEGALISANADITGDDAVRDGAAIGIHVGYDNLGGTAVGEDMTLSRSVTNAGDISVTSTISAGSYVAWNSGAIGIKTGEAYVNAYTAYADPVTLTSEVDVTNSGIIVADTTIDAATYITDNAGAFGIRAGLTEAYIQGASTNALVVASTNISNEGSIVATAELKAGTYFDDSVGAFGIKVGETYAYDGSATSSGSATATVSNAGSIQAMATIEAGDYINESTGSYGIRVGYTNAYDDSTATTDVNNSGSIVSTATITAPQMAESNGAYGIRVGDDSNYAGDGLYNVTVSNSGSIVADATINTDYENGTNYNRGAFGIRTGSALVVNSGSIEASATMNGLNDSAYDGAYGIRTGEGSATVVNTGSISATLVDTDDSTLQRAVGIMTGQDYNEIHLSGSVSASSEGGDAYSIVMGCEQNTGTDNALLVMNGASLNGDLLNAAAAVDLDPAQAATAILGLTQGEDGKANLGLFTSAADLIDAFGDVGNLDELRTFAADNEIAADPDFNITINNDFLGTEAGWNLLLAGGTTTLNNGEDSWIEGVYVAPGATFAGNAFVGDLRSAGNLMPGDGGIGTMVVYGDFSQAADSTYFAEVGNYDAADLISVAGTAYLEPAVEEGGAGAKIHVAPAGYVADGAVYTVLSAGLLDGFYADADLLEDSAVLNFSLLNEDDNTVKIVAERIPYSELGVGPNEQNVANALRDAALNGDEAASAYIGMVDGQADAGDVEEGLRALSPEMYPSLLDATMAGAGLYRSTVVGRLATLHLAKADSSSQYASNTVTKNGPALSRLSTEGREAGSLSTWVRGVGMTATQDSNKGYEGFDLDTAGVALGLDVQVSSNVAVGASFGLSSSNIDFTGSNKTDVDSYNVGLYGTFTEKAFYVDGGLFYAGNDYDSRATRLGDRVTSSTEGAEWGLYLGAGYKLVDTDSWFLTPTASVEYAQADIDGFTEKGSSLTYKVNDYDADSLVSTVGFRMGAKLDMGTAKLEPEVRVAWGHEYGDADRTVKARFVGGTSTYSFKGVEPESDSALVGAGINAYLTDKFSLSVDYDGEFRSDFDGHSIAAMLRYKF